MKKAVSLLICCLLIMSFALTLVRANTAVTLTSSMAGSTYDSALNQYDRYSLMTYTGSMQYSNGGTFYPNDGLVGVQIQDSTGATMLVRTISTGLNNTVQSFPANPPADVDKAYLCDLGGNPITSIPMPTASNQVTPTLYVHLINNEQSTQNMIVVVSILDSNAVPIAFFSSPLNVAGGTASYVKSNFLIQPWAHYGQAYAYVSIFSGDLPSNGGVPLATEKTFGFTITGGAPFPGTAPTTFAYNGVNRLYNFTFRLLSQQTCPLGTCNVYSTVNYPYAAYTTGTYIGNQASQTTNFQVAQLGDLNSDGVLNFVDIQLFVHYYILYYNQGTYTASVDFNHDSKINFADIQLFVHYYIYYYSP